MASLSYPWLYLWLHRLFMILNVVFFPTDGSYPFTGAWFMRNTTSCESMMAPYEECSSVPLFPTTAHRFH